ncbi:MAG: nuA3 HAT complex component nto1 [Piccolia ochrophora]|nr:MAG: nuA3 HAT complex component nto1 [Piccolia ochrophora]
MASNPRYSSAAAVAAAVVQGDGYKPREERGWEEFHPHLDIDATLFTLGAEEVDGTSLLSNPPDTSLFVQDVSEPDQTLPANGADASTPQQGALIALPITSRADDAMVQGDGSPQKDFAEIIYKQSRRKRVGRPSRRAHPLQNGFSTPTTPKHVPPPGPNPREKLTLPKPSFRPTDPFAVYESKSTGQQRYVDRPMANAGYQESDVFFRPEAKLIRVAEGTSEEDIDLGPGFRIEANDQPPTVSTWATRVEYDMDEQDDKWLAVHNERRKSVEAEPITREVFEITMTRIEKEWHALEKRIPKPNPKPPQTHRPRSSSAAAVNGEPATAVGEEQDSKCAICDDGDCENTNAIVFCDGCDLAVHQECYGVPFIPEGQWLCRKCQLLGRSTTTCIFCPNTDGAFKQTNATRWAHLLCAIWIPEVSLGNSIFMEPVLDVEKVPRQRWKLICYICRQKMGACIQCGNKNCFVAFHVTCARKARLCLKMKSAHGGPVKTDSSLFKAYCDKHVPADWRWENDVDAALADAQDFYRYTMRGTVWADGHSSAPTVALEPARPPTASSGNHSASHRPKINLTIGASRRKRAQVPKSLWRLPSGAPVIPQVVLNSVEASLQRYAIRKKKDYAAEACKYWTLKREARRGAALLKRLQLQMETFSSWEITRRNFAGMGAAGKVRLQRRVEFTLQLLQDVERLRLLCDDVKKREREKLKEAEMLGTTVDTVYFPLAPLLWPILERAYKLDGKAVFHKGFDRLRSKLSSRTYTSIAAFSADLRSLFNSDMGISVAGKTTEAHSNVAPGVVVAESTVEGKDQRRLAKRIVKAIQAPLEEATRMEAQICGKPFEKELKDLEMLLDTTMLSQRDSTAPSVDEESSDVDAMDTAKSPQRYFAASEEQTQDDVTPKDADRQALSGEANAQASGPLHQDERNGHSFVSTTGSEAEERPYASRDSHVRRSTTHAREALTHTRVEGGQRNGWAQGTGTHSRDKLVDDARVVLVQSKSDIMLAEGDLTAAPAMHHPQEHVRGTPAPMSVGGIPWYLEPFDPIGTTVHEERWTGREVVRGMSEELSEIDDEELQGLVDNDMEGEGEPPPMDGHSPHRPRAGVQSARRPRGKRSKTGRKSRGQRW